MRFILLLGFQLLTSALFCQVTKTNKIDSIVNQLERIEHFYRADSVVNVYDKDSNLVASSSMEFFYKDKKGKDLFKVDELRLPPANTSVIFYYNNRLLIKIDIRFYFNDKFFQAELFYEKQHLIYERRKGDLVFQIDYSELYNRSKKYLKYKPGMISQNWIN